MKKSKIASDILLAILGKVFPGRPIVTYRKKNGTHPAGDGTLWLCSTPSRMQPSSKKRSLFHGWHLHEPRVAPLLVHPFWSQFSCAPWASHTLSPSAQSPWSNCSSHDLTVSLQHLYTIFRALTLLTVIVFSFREGKNKTKDASKQKLYPIAFVKMVLFIVNTMNSLKEAFKNMRHQLMANCN